MDNIKLTIRKRYEFIEKTLLDFGYINRSDLKKKFEISTPQATNDLTFYKGLCPDNLEYSNSKKKYLILKSFKAVFHKDENENFIKSTVEDITILSTELNSLSIELEEIRKGLIEYMKYK